MIPTISIIIPVYNTEEYLRETLDSLVSQTFADFEALLIDDGSKDSSGAICDEYAAKDPRFRVVHKENAGPAAARNVGLDMARGEFLMFCDSDDLYKPECCERMLALIRGHGCDAVMCGNEFFGDAVSENRGLDEGYYNPGLNREVGHEADDGIFRLNVLLWNKIFRRSKVVDNGIRFPDGHEHDDNVFCYQYALCSERYYCTDERLYRYRIRTGSIMSAYFSGKPKNREDRLFMIESVLDFAVRLGLERTHRKFLLGLAANNYKMITGFFDAEELAGVRDRIMSRFGFLFTDSCSLEVDADGLYVRCETLGLVDVFKFIEYAVRCAVAPAGSAGGDRRGKKLCYYRRRARLYLGLGDGVR